jgi:hypothetical protein
MPLFGIKPWPSSLLSLSLLADYAFRYELHIVTDLIKAGNSSVNSPTHTGGQQYSRTVFYVVRAETVDFYC